MRDSTAEFISQACALPPASLASAFDRAVSLRRAGGREASRALKLSAAANSELEHAVKQALLPRADELNGFRDGLHADSVSVVTITARAVEKSEQLTPEQHTVLAAPFVELGLAVPAAG